MKQRCGAMNREGLKCRNKVIDETHYHGSSELYGDTSIPWVTIPVCKKHLEESIP